VSGQETDRALIDTSVVIALEVIEFERLKFDLAVSALTLAELASGPISATDDVERAKRQECLQLTESTFEVLAFDPACARSYGRISANVVAQGRKARGRRVLDLMIAATALANDLPLLTLNPADLRGLEDLIEVIDLS
jgi:predicted nucleic acid-binding protein